MKPVWKKVCPREVDGSYELDLGLELDPHVYDLFWNKVADSVADMQIAVFGDLDHMRRLDIDNFPGGLDGWDMVWFVTKDVIQFDPVWDIVDAGLSAVQNLESELCRNIYSNLFDTECEDWT